MAVTPEEARAELARRELERRQQDKPIPLDESNPRPLSVYEPGSLLRAGAAIGDLALSGIQGLGARLAGGVAAAPVALSDPEASQQIFSNVTESLSRPLASQGAQAFAERISPAVESVETGITDVFGAVPGGPVAQAGARTAVQAPLELLGIRGVGQAAKMAAAGPVTPGSFIPEIKDLFGAGRVAFNEARLAGGGIRPEALARATNRIRNIENDIGLKIEFDPDLHGPAFVVRERLLRDLDGNPATGQVDFDELLTLRELASDVAGNSDRAISMRGVRLKNEIDDFVDSLGPDDVISGDPQKAAQALSSARQFWRDASTARTIEREIELAGNRAGQFSGSGFENALRTQFRQLHARIIKGRERGFKPDEIAAIKKVAEGGPVGNLFRFFGKTAPTGIVSGGIGAIGGGMAFGPAGAVGIPLIGVLGRMGATRATINNANAALQIPLRNSLLERTPPVR